MKDRENRQNNIVIYNMPEQRTDDKVEWYTNERKQCMELLNNILKVGIEEEGIIKIIRLGKKDSSQCRPQLVQFRSKMQKMQQWKISVNFKWQKLQSGGVS